MTDATNNIQPAAFWVDNPATIVPVPAVPAPFWGAPVEITPTSPLPLAPSPYGPHCPMPAEQTYNVPPLAVDADTVQQIVRAEADRVCGPLIITITELTYKLDQLLALLEPKLAGKQLYRPPATAVVKASDDNMQLWGQALAEVRGPVRSPNDGTEPHCV